MKVKWEEHSLQHLPHPFRFDVDQRGRDTWAVVAVHRGVRWPLCLVTFDSRTKESKRSRVMHSMVDLAHLRLGVCDG